MTNWTLQWTNAEFLKILLTSQYGKGREVCECGMRVIARQGWEECVWNWKNFCWEGSEERRNWQRDRRTRDLVCRRCVWTWPGIRMVKGGRCRRERGCSSRGHQEKVRWNWSKIKFKGLVLVTMSSEEADEDNPGPKESVTCRAYVRRQNVGRSRHLKFPKYKTQITKRWHIKWFLRQCLTCYFYLIVLT